MLENEKENSKDDIDQVNRLSSNEESNYDDAENSEFIQPYEILQYQDDEFIKKMSKISLLHLKILCILGELKQIAAQPHNYLVTPDYDLKANDALNIDFQTPRSMKLSNKPESEPDPVPIAEAPSPQLHNPQTSIAESKVIHLAISISYRRLGYF